MQPEPAGHDLAVFLLVVEIGVVEPPPGGPELPRADVGVAGLIGVAAVGLGAEDRGRAPVPVHKVQVRPRALMEDKVEPVLRLTDVFQFICVGLVHILLKFLIGLDDPAFLAPGEGEGQ